jgi:aminoglycoside 6'-N-acetyltransferase I
MNIRKVPSSDKDEWARRRKYLWPGSLQDHLDNIDTYFSKGETDIVEVYVIKRNNGTLGGFIEINVRNYAKGSVSRKVPYVEGCFVDMDLRGQEYGKQLMLAAEMWAMKNGFNELSSDAEIDNSNSIAAHKALGFNEVDRIVLSARK